MKNLKVIYTIIICVLYSSINAQEKSESQEAFAIFEINDARDNGDDITPDAIEESAKLVLYKSVNGKNILFSNYWAKSNSQSFGRIYSITKEEKAANEKEYRHALYNFQWSYNNSYDDKKGTAKIELFIIYKPQGVYFECTVIQENLNVVVYKGRMEGDLAALESSAKK
jgi:hypothetical protein